MRITTQMLHGSMKKAGLPIDSMSLLSCMNRNSTQKNGLLSALEKNNAASQTQKKSFEKLKGTADELQQAADALHSKELFDQAREEKDNKSVAEYARSLVEHYNDTMKSLKNTSSPLHQYYRQMLSEAVKENKESLESVGITQEKDGALKLDQNKMEAAGTDALEQALGGVFSEKLSFLADRIADNAKANADSASNQYNAFGNHYFAQANTYDFWG